jgi:AraC-like DNA-binding protein
MGKLIHTPASPYTDFDSWQDQVLNTFCPMEIKARQCGLEAFNGEVFDTTLDRIHLSRISSNAMDVYRHKQHIALMSDCFYLVKFQLEGQGLVQQAGREAYLNPGDFVVCSTSDPYQLHFEDHYRQAVLAIPHPVMNGMFEQTDDFLGVRMGSDVPTNSLLSSFVQNLVHQIDVLDPAIAQRLEANVLDMLVTSFYAASNVKNTTTNTSSTDHHLRAIKRLIAINLRNPNLSTDFIAEKEGISKRYLHMLFKAEEITISRYILQQRLKACRRILATPELSHLSTTEIAHEWGFSDASHFHRCFKAQFEITPRQFRLVAAAG